MHPFLIRLGLICVFVSSMVVALTAAPAPEKAPAAMDYSKEALVFERYEMTYRMHADGTGERANHVLLRIQSEGAARQFSVLSFGYAAANETPHIALVRVHKADGSTVDTPAADAMEMAAAVTREAPLYSDLKEKHVPVRSLSVGDTLEYEVSTTIDKAEAAGQFWGAHHFTVPGTFVVRDEVLTVEVPRDKYVQVWSPNHKPVVTEKDGVRSYVWHVAQLAPAAKGEQGADTEAKDGGKGKAKTPKNPDEDAEGRKVPSVAWTTFHTWAEVGDWYRGLSLARAQPSDALKARAEEITKEAKTPEEQVRAIYQFVSGRTRYVGIDFGVGRYQPHAAMEVLANQYGDCKDKDTLLEALLRAKGFKTAPALIGAGIAPTPEVPSPATFNHVITTVNLPEERIWLDSTAEVGPYRYLTAILRDVQALVVPVDGAAGLEKTPAEPPYPLETKFEAEGALDGEGKLTAKVKATYRTDDEIFVRGLARNVAPAEWDKASQYISSNTGFGGTTSDTHFAGVDDLSKPIEISYEYTRRPFGDWENRRIIPMFPTLDLGLLASDGEEPEADIELGAPRTVIAESRIKLPEGYHADVPDPVHVKTEFASFDKTYRFDGKEIAAERKVVVLQKKVAKADWKKYQAFAKAISLEGEPWIQLIRPTVKVVSAQGKANTHEVTNTVEPDAEELLRKASVLMRAADWDNAMTVLDEVKAINPEQANLWASYGMIAAVHHKDADAKVDFVRELKAHPDNSLVVAALADTEARSGDEAGARKTMQAYLERHPDDVKLSLYLASLQTKAEDHAGALKTLEKAAELNPADKTLQVEVSKALLKLDRKDEAVAAAKSVLGETDDAMVLNNAAYVLSNAEAGMADAEEASRKSVQILEDKSAAITTGEANSNAFAQSNLLQDAWDTLGWILFREGKPEAAKPLILAAWRNGLKAEVGDHLGQVYEAMGAKDAAYEAYSRAAATMERAGLAAEVSKHTQESISRLRNAGAKTEKKTDREALQDSRTYKVPGVSSVSGWGTFRLQVTATGVMGAQQVSGEKKLAGLETAIDGMKLPELVPPDSKAHLLRSGVVSCASGKVCELVLVPNGGLRTETY